jgi:hypothetical protein
MIFKLQNNREMILHIFFDGKLCLLLDVGNRIFFDVQLPE